ncbi:hypothetical protein EFL95_09830 [Nocardioides marmorisolisilvae]|uniref:Bacterial Ig-like domain-containing protein n=1 Tax=Nocardioides marmorisolisilvae TaxID=1542737 RepID=A0A3N0DUJ2_9ACTN|nr:hypothetical protein EFL95_09830 [Nocardioides marmorisolisilvae]
MAAGFLAAATALIGPASPAGAAPNASATIGDVSCVDTDGTVTVDLQAGDSDAATFTVLVDGSSYGDDTEVDAAGTGQVVVTGLEDGDHTVEVLAFVGDSDGDTVASSDISVACDVAPEGPYTNIKGDVYDGCEYTGVVSASNKAIAGDTDDLQPVEFQVVFTPTDDPVDDPGDSTDDGTGDGTDPAPDPAPRVSTVGVEEVLATFTLDAENQTYDSTFELGTTGDLVLRAGETTVASTHIGRCEVVAVENTAGGGHSLPDTGF